MDTQLVTLENNMKHIAQTVGVITDDLLSTQRQELQSFERGLRSILTTIERNMYGLLPILQMIVSKGVSFFLCPLFFFSPSGVTRLNNRVSGKDLSQRSQGQRRSFRSIPPGTFRLPSFSLLCSSPMDQAQNPDEERHQSSRARSSGCTKPPSAWPSFANSSTGSNKWQ